MQTKMGEVDKLLVKKLIAKAKRAMIQRLNKNKHAYSTVRSNHLMEGALIRFSNKNKCRKNDLIQLFVNYVGEANP